MLTGIVLINDAHAQQPKLTGNIVRDIQSATGKPASSGFTGAPITDLENALNAKFLPDLQYALKLATASNNTITASCYQAWIDIINTQQAAVQDSSDATASASNAGSRTSLPSSRSW